MSPIQWMLQYGNDPIVWLRLVKALLFLIAAWLMYMEPMRCGGENKWFHRLIAACFGTLSYYCWEVAHSRITILQQNPNIGFDLPLIAIEILALLSILSVIIWLGVDYYRFKTYDVIRYPIEPCKTCTKKFQP